MRKQLADAAIVCAMFLWLTACGDEAVEVPEYQIASSVEEKEESSDSEQVPEDKEKEEPSDSEQVSEDKEKEEPFDSERLPEDIVKQIGIYVDQREVWFFEEKDSYIHYYYAWNDLNQDGKLELICSWNEGTGRYSSDYVYAVNSDGEVECGMEITGDIINTPDFLWGLELYADEYEGQDMPEHFYIRSHDYTPDGPYYYDSDMVIIFTGDLTEWQLQRMRRSIEKYDDYPITFNSEPVNTEYYDGDGESVSQEEWERLEEEFLKDKEFITSDFEWDDLGSYLHGENKGISLSDRELGEALEELYINWQELIKEN